LENKVTKNNLLIYLAPLKTIGEANDVMAAAAIVSAYDSGVFGVHTGSDLLDLKSVLSVVKEIKPTFKVYGYTNLGTAVDLAGWEASAGQWQVDLDSSLLDGVFIDEFDFSTANGTRVNQNAAITYLHITLSLPGFVNGRNLADLFSTEPPAVVPVLGSSTTLTDVVLLDNFLDENTANPMPEPKALMEGRLKFIYSLAHDTVQVLPTPPATTVVTQAKWNVKFGVAIGAGNQLTVPLADYKKVLDLTLLNPLALLAVTPKDNGLLTHRYFLANNANDFDTVE
jgi:hypothetical protein